MKTLTTSAALAILLGAAPAFAEGTLNPALVEMVTSLDAAGTIAAPIWSDLDGDGDTDLVVVGAQTDADGMVAWQIYDGASGAEVFSQMAAVVKVEPLPDTGAAVVADGVKWAWNGYSTLPTYDIVRENLPYLSPPTAADIAALASLGYVDVLAESIDVLRLDLVANPGRERLVTVMDDMWQEADFATPWFLFAEDDTLLLTGTSIFHPAIFTRDDGGLTVIEDRDTGMTMTILAPGILPAVVATAPNFEDEMQ